MKKIVSLDLASFGDIYERDVSASLVSFISRSACYDVFLNLFFSLFVTHYAINLKTPRSNAFYIIEETFEKATFVNA